MKTSELTGAKLDYWVAKAEGLAVPRPGWASRVSDGVRIDTEFCPSSDWAAGGPIIAAHDWLLPYRTPPHRAHLGAYTSRTPGGFEYSGATPLIAAMRAYVVSKFGNVTCFDFGPMTPATHIAKT